MLSLEPITHLELGRLESLANRLRVLATRTADFWWHQGPDPEHGGFHGTLGRDGEPKAPTSKGLVQQTRHLWTLSMWYERRQRVAQIERLADSTYSFILGHLLDPRDGQFFHLTDVAGKVIDPKKQLYAQGFAVYALATYGRVFGRTHAVDLAVECFRSCDTRYHDAKQGGYNQKSDPGWLSPGASKETNTHIHLMEALTALVEVSSDPRARARLEELVEIVSRRLVQPAGYAHFEFHQDFTPFGNPAVSYGHDLETAWLLLDAKRALAEPVSGELRQSVLRLAEHAAEFGYDQRDGGYYLEGLPRGPVTQVEKVWWVQFEALAGLWWLYRLTRNAEHLTRLAGTLGYVERVEDPGGEWFWGHLPNGKLGSRGANKGEAWKTGYHNLRALVYLEDWMRGAITECQNLNNMG